MIRATIFKSFTSRGINISLGGGAGVGRRGVLLGVGISLRISLAVSLAMAA